MVPNRQKYTFWILVFVPVVNTRKHIAGNGNEVTAQNETHVPLYVSCYVFDMTTVKPLQRQASYPKDPKSS